MERFWSKVNKNGANECWEWIACKCHGYGYIVFEGKSVRAHRLSWIFEFGPIPKDKIVCHSCDNPACVNPKHLFLGSWKDNSQDAHKKGRTKNEFIPHKLTESDVLAIRKKYIPYKYSCRKLAQEYSVAHSMIWLIIKKKTWKYI
jgi:hypothetical protein